MEPDARPSSVEERWILARIDATRAEFEADLAAFDFAHAVERLYHLTFDDFCDWYLESIKPRLEEEDVARDGASRRSSGSSSCSIR